MSRKINYTSLSDDYVRFYSMDGDGLDRAGNANATITNGTFTASSFSYISEQLDWGASTSFTYSSATYTNSYLIKNGEVFKNSGEVSATELSGASGSSYQGLIMYNRTLTTSEEDVIKSYAKRRLGPNTAHRINGAGIYSLPNLEEGKLLEISKPQSGGVYYNQTGNGNNGTAINVTDSTVGLANVMSFNGSSSYVDNGTATLITGINTTISCRFKPNVINSDDFIFNLSDGGNYHYFADIYNSVLYIYVDTGSVYDGLTFTPIQGEWKELIIITDGTNLIATYNGETKTTAHTTNGVQNSLFGRNIIGSRWYNGNADSFFDGQISQPLIYNRALLSKEVEQLYYSQKANFIG